jgi:FSR family fosmidomycin resistance protein-like MFS transporter
LIDELASGIPYGSAAQIERAFGLSYTATAIVMFVVPGAIAMVVEPFVFLLADRYPRALFLRGGVTLMAISLAAVALAPGPIVLAIAIAVFWIAIGSSVSIAQATLVDRNPESRGRTMARWTLLSTAGDFLVPFVIGGVSFAGHGWRVAHVVVAIAIALFAAMLWRADIPSDLGASENDEPSPGLLATLKDALGDKLLMAWLFGVALCDLLDEILVVFASIHLRDHLGGGIRWQSAMILAMTIGGGIGLVVLERILAKRSERTMLLICASACAISFVAWISAPWLPLSVALMGLVGMFAAPLYPLAAAQAYAQRPEASGSVLAAQSLFAPIGLALPFVVGFIADRAGTYVALLVLIAQPLGLVALTVVTPRGGARTSRDRGDPPDASATPPPAPAPPA